MSIGALTGVRRADAGVASGLLNTTQQIGGAIGVAVATTIATTYTSHYVAGSPGHGRARPAALTHGFQIAFYVLAGIALRRGRPRPPRSSSRILRRSPARTSSASSR